jgi:hypothetical protein
MRISYTNISYFQSLPRVFRFNPNPKRNEAIAATTPECEAFYAARRQFHTHERPPQEICCQGTIAVSAPFTPQTPEDETVAAVSAIVRSTS